MKKMLLTTVVTLSTTWCATTSVGQVGQNSVGPVSQDIEQPSIPAPEQPWPTGLPVYQRSRFQVSPQPRQIGDIPGTKSNIEKLLSRFKNAKTEEAKQEVKDEVEKLLGNTFDGDMQKRNAELAKLEKKVADMRAQYDSRMQQRDRIVSLRAQLLIDQQNGMEWREPMADQSRSFQSANGVGLNFTPPPALPPVGRSSQQLGSGNFSSQGNGRGLRDVRWDEPGPSPVPVNIDPRTFLQSQDYPRGLSQVPTLPEGAAATGGSRPGFPVDWDGANRQPSAPPKD